MVFYDTQFLDGKRYLHVDRICEFIVGYIEERPGTKANSAGTRLVPFTRVIHFVVETNPEILLRLLPGVQRADGDLADGGPSASYFVQGEDPTGRFGTHRYALIA